MLQQSVQPYIRPPLERGQVLVVFALLLPVLFATLALIVDAGYEYGQRREAQNAADAASLAAALVVGANGNCSSGNSSAISQAGELARRNGATSPTLTFTAISSLTPPGATQPLPVCQVAAGTAVTNAPFLSGVLGRTSLTANAHATAAVAGLASYGNRTTYAPLLPVAIDLSSFTTYGFGTTVQRFAVTQAGANGFYWFVPNDGTACSDAQINDEVTTAAHMTINAGGTVTTCPLEDDAALDALAARSPVLRTAALTVTNPTGSVSVEGFVFLQVQLAEHGDGIVPAIYGYFVYTGTPTSGTIGGGTSPNYGVYNVGLIR